MQPGGRAEGESETQDRLKKTIKKKIFFQTLNRIIISRCLEVVVFRFSAKEGGRSDPARPRTTMQVVHKKTSRFIKKHQGLTRPVPVAMLSRANIAKQLQPLALVKC